MKNIPDLPLTLPDAPADLAEIEIHQEVLLQGGFLHVLRDTVTLPDGSIAKREYIQHSGAVVIVAQLDDGRYLLEYQYRHPMQCGMIEFPAGKLDTKEQGWHCACRELLEETGYAAQQWAFAGSMHNCIAYSNEQIDIWFAKQLQYQGQRLDEGEFLRLYAATLPDLLEAMRTGRITDAKTITALMWLQQVASGAWQLQWQQAE